MIKLSGIQFIKTKIAVVMSINNFKKVMHALTSKQFYHGIYLRYVNFIYFQDE